MGRTLAADSLSLSLSVCLCVCERVFQITWIDQYASLTFISSNDYSNWDGLVNGMSRAVCLRHSNWSRLKRVYDVEPGVKFSKAEAI